jgi:hypothetical protein
MDVPVTVGPPATLPPASNTHAPGFVSALDVRIDVKGAYIVDESSEEAAHHRNGTNNSRSGGDNDDGGEFEAEDEDVQRDSRDIRLPHQRSFVSHMAIDVSAFLEFCQVQFLVRRWCCGRCGLGEHATHCRKEPMFTIL